VSVLSSPSLPTPTARLRAGVLKLREDSESLRTVSFLFLADLYQSGFHIDLEQTFTNIRANSFASRSEGGH